MLIGEKCLVWETLSFRFLTMQSNQMVMDWPIRLEQSTIGAVLGMDRFQSISHKILHLNEKKIILYLINNWKKVISNLLHRYLTLILAILSIMNKNCRVKYRFGYSSNYCYPIHHYYCCDDYIDDDEDDDDQPRNVTAVSMLSILWVAELVTVPQF